MSGIPDMLPGDPKAARIFSKYFFSGVQSAPGFMKLMSGPPPTLGENMPYLQTDTGYPIVKAVDCGKGKGQTIQFTLYNIFTGKPVMGSENLAGKFMNATSSTKTVMVDQSRGGTSIDEMGRYRTVNDLRMVAMRGMRNWGIRLADQTCMVHLFGARGSQNFEDWVIPLKSDADFAKIMVNPVLAPTKNRRFIAGSAGHTGVASMTVTDILSLKDVGRLGAQLAKSNVPIMPVNYEDQAALGVVRGCRGLGFDETPLGSGKLAGRSHRSHEAI
jgi:N4-gp56 family major capsid protein